MKNLKTLFLEKIKDGLKRDSIQEPASWAENYRVMPKGNWNFKFHPWLKEMHNSDAELNIGQKSAQMGYTETVLNLAFYHIDMYGRDCLYVLPSKTPDASDFSASRFDASLDLSPHLNNLFSDVRNVGHKRAGAANLYIRGSNSKAGLRSIPVSVIVVDEVDVMNQANIPLLMERVSGQMEYWVWMISTPTIPKKGINKYFLESSQEHFFFKCPRCSRLTELVYPDCLVVTAEKITDPSLKDSHLICKECKGTLDHKAKPEWLANAEWVPKYNYDSRGFYISQLYSCMVKPQTLAASHLRAQYNPADEQELYNSKLGLPHTVAGAQITAEQVEDCKGNYKQGAKPSKNIITMGIDVGRWLHYEIIEWEFGKKQNSVNDMAVGKVLRGHKCKEFEELNDLMHRYNVTFAVIDANPEKRKSLEFCNRFYGRAKMAYYHKGNIGRTISVHSDIPSITVDRTVWLDVALGRFKNKTISIPLDVGVEYEDHMQALARIYTKDAQGNIVGRYDKPDHIEDHFAHARAYSEMALPFAVNFNSNKDVNRLI